MFVLLLACTASSEAQADPCDLGGGEGAVSTCLSPTQPDTYYVEQSLLYFDTLESGADPGHTPVYAEGVARWEWPPWLLLTGFGRDDMETADALIRLIPTTVPIRECRAFPVQPFGRCRVEFVYEEYEGRTCPIYEEFTFDNAGEMTFIEAWSDLPAYTPTSAADPWAEGAAVSRLSTRLPGLGNAEGEIDIDSVWMRDAADKDVDVADFVARAEDFYGSWLTAYQAAGDDLFVEGCGW